MTRARIRAYQGIAVGTVGVVLTILFIVIGLSFPPSAKAPDARMAVAATIFPVYDLVRTVGGDRVAVELLLPEGESPETLPRLYNGVRLDETTYIFAIGLDFDTVGIPDEYRDKLVTLERDVDLLLAQGSAGSPYYWLSLANASRMTSTIAETLAYADPASAEYYRDNATRMIEQIKNYDRQIAELFSELPQRQLVVYGYDWQYFARDYDLTIIEYEPGASISQGRADALAQVAIDNGLVAVFTDTTISPEAFLPALSRQYFSLFHLDVFGGVEERTSYLKTMAYNAIQVYQGLTGAP